jgi:tetratricopeptide (TPR) repeat protein
MGVVYKAFDTLMKREVALKTLLDIDNPTTLELFYKEWGVLATMVHPNVIGIYDIGEFRHEGVTKPFFVMPLLPGVTLDKLIKDGSPRLTVDRIVEIIAQSARGLHAVHEMGLVHRDVKPSNIFVMDDDSVKIIDFGVAHLVSTGSKTSLKGTLFYMAPEQLQMQQPSPLSDQFALGVVCYETLTRRRPFQGNSEPEIIDAILRHVPPPASDLNPNVKYGISQVIHKVLAKQPYHRFLNLREFSEALQKALRGEPLEYFDSSKVKPRLERARQSFEEGDFSFAAEILSELEGEGHLDQEITLLRRQLDQAVRRGDIQKLLERARRFLEAQEYPLALRKIQEALERDPEDAGALALKAQVERQRRERKIGEWIQLAHQHLDNHAFRQAREALENVLKLKPNETGALRLLAEVNRREQELQRAREEKAKLYQAALHAWEKGEVTSALSKLEYLVKLDKEMPEADSGRSNTYQNLYNQVRSEHDAIENAYEEARRRLSEENFEVALTLCKNALTKYPNHALFQALKFDVEERQRQNLSALIAETDRKVEEEPDLDRRVAILEAVLKRFPEEPHFERALKLVRDKRDLVESIVSKARFFEERNQINEALDQWQILRSIHEKYPGLGFEIERLMKRRDQLAREQSRSRWVEEVDRHLESGDHERAARTIENALAEFPGDSELAELEKVVRRNQERATQAQQLLAEARDLSEKGQADESLVPLREAYALDPRNTVIRTVLSNSLLDHARKLVESDSPLADAVINELLELEPNHSAALSLSSQLADRKREEFVSRSIAQARRLQGDGDLAGALAAVDNAIASYPKEARLIQLQATLRRGQAEATSTSPRGRDLREIQKLEADARDPGQRTGVFDRLQAILKRYPNDDEVQQAAAQVLTALAGAPAAGPGETPQPVTPASQPSKIPKDEPSFDSAETSAVVTPTPPAEAGKPEVRKPEPKKPDVKKPEPGKPDTKKTEASTKTEARTPPKKADKPAQPAGKLPGWLIPTAAAFLLVAGGLIAWRVLRPDAAPRQEASPSGQRVVVRASQPGATITLNQQNCGTGSCETDLPPGRYKVEATLFGYETAAAEFDVAEGATGPRDPIVLNLTALPPLVSISSDLTEAVVTINGQRAGQLQGGSLDLATIPAGQHTLQVSGGISRAQFQFELAEGAMPKLLSPVQTLNFKGVVIVSVGSTARLYSSVPGEAVTLDGNPAGTTSPEGVELTNLSPGSHEVALGSGAQPQRIAFDAGGSPTLRASLSSNQNIGSLRLSVNEDNATVYIDGSRHSRPTSRGRHVSYLTPGKHTIRVEKEGYVTPPDQSVEIRRSEEAQLEFKLAIAPQKSTLYVRNAAPGADVFLNNSRIGVVGADGTYSNTNIEPGRYTVAVRKDRVRPVQGEQQFAPGKIVEIVGTTESTVGTLRIEVTPPGVNPTLRLRKDGETTDRPLTETTVQLPEGYYTVTGSAPGYQTYEAGGIHVTPGRTATATVALRRTEAPLLRSPAERRPVFQLADWERLAGWAKEGAGLVKRGGDYTLGPPSQAGAYQFTVLSQRGRRIEWVFAFRDERNFVLYQIDDNEFKRIEVNNGRRNELRKVRHGLNYRAAIGLLAVVAPNTINISVDRGGQWALLDSWERSGPTLGGASFTVGRMGFYVPGRDQILLSDFKFTPN